MDNDYCYKIFCTNIRNLRIKNGLSKKKMAKILGIGVNSLCRLEAGEVPPRLGCHILYRIWEHFNISADSMFAPLPDMEKFY